MLNYVIIGGGVAGLYANFKLSHKNHECLLLEKNDDVFGRAREHDFHGTMVKCGAGIAVPENKTVVKLLKKFGMPTKAVIGKAISDERLPPFDMKNAVKDIKKKFKHMKKKDLSELTAREILFKYFGDEFATQFIRHSEFHDWLDSSFDYLFKYYDIDEFDNAAFPKIFVSWTQFVHNLTLPNIQTKYTVTKIEKKGKVFVINDDIVTENIVFALSLDALEKINLVGFGLPKYSNYIGYIPFARVYAYYEKGYTLKDDYIMVDGPCDKLVKINDKILMVSYSDGDNAKFWMNVKKMNKEDRARVIHDELAKIGYDFGIPDDVFSAEWTAGDHYFKPYPSGPGKFDKLLNRLQKPRKGVFVVGEMISKRVGYVEGALISVDRVFPGRIK